MDTDSWNYADKGYHVQSEEMKVKISCECMELTTFSLHIHVARELIFSYRQIFTHMLYPNRRA